jgi:malate synthase
MADITVTGGPVERSEQILTEEALAFLAELQERFGPTREELLKARGTRRAEVSKTGRLDFLEDTREVREGDWQVAAAPMDFQDRRVEITGPTERKMAINALNSGAKVWLADLEDANTPHWANVIGGQVNLHDAVRRTIELTTPQGKHYALNDPDGIPTIVPRPRGWHLDEEHLQLGGTPLVGALVDFGLYFFHNAKELLERGSGPYFYLPKMESHLEARLWNDVFTFAEERVGIPHGTVRATVLIETIPAAFEMDEILYELREHAAGLNAGRWDYLFSIIKYFRDAGPSFTLPDRNAVTMNAPMMKAYSDLLVQTCHKRGAFAIGGMAAFIPSKDPKVNEEAFAKVRADKEREANAGFDGSWVAHPGMVELCKEVFTAKLGNQPNQLGVLREDVKVSADDLLDASATPGELTLDGLRGNVSVGIQYLAAWLGGNGAAGINNLMEDAATAEISRSQIWQWLNNEAQLASGEKVTKELVTSVVDEEYAALQGAVGDDDAARGHLEAARKLFFECAVDPDFPDFLTLPAYEEVLREERASAAPA